METEGAVFNDFQDVLESPDYARWLMRLVSDTSGPLFVFGGNTLALCPGAMECFSQKGKGNGAELSEAAFKEWPRKELDAGLAAVLKGEQPLDEALLEARLFDAFDRLTAPRAPVIAPHSAASVPVAIPSCATSARKKQREPSADAEPKSKPRQARAASASPSKGNASIPPAKPFVPPPTPVREPTHQVSKRIVQVSGVLRPTNADPTRNLELARTTTLRWLAQKGVAIPEAAFDGAPFERDITQARHPVIVDATAECWALQFDTINAEENGRTWRVEVVLYRQEARTLVGLVLTVIDAHGTENIRHTSIPQLVRRLTDAVGLFDDGRLLDAKPIQVETSADVDRLVDLLESPTRTRAVVVVARDDAGRRLIEPDYLAQRLAGVAHVVDVDPGSSWELTRRYGRLLSVYGLGVRVYRPSFDPDVDAPSVHPLFVGERWLERGRALRDRLIELAAEQTTKAGDDAVPSFAAVRRWIAENRLQEARRSASTRTEQMVLLEKENERLKADVEAAQELAAEATQEREHAKAREQDHQELARQLRVRVAWLEQRLRAAEDASAAPVVEEMPYPDTWDDLEDWTERWLGGQVIVLPVAVRKARKSLFRDIPLAYRALAMLGEYQQMRVLGTVEAKERYEKTRDGLRLDVSSVGDALNNHRTKDHYMATWNGRRIALALHVSGSSSRRKEEGFRLYFSYDEDAELVVVGHFPTHLPNALT
jgi:hypothetical protein